MTTQSRLAKLIGEEEAARYLDRAKALTHLLEAEGVTYKTVDAPDQRPPALPASPIRPYVQDLLSGRAVRS